MTKPNKTPNVDAVFGPDLGETEKGAIIMSTAQRVAELAASCGITMPGKPGTYQPDLFLDAVERMRDQINEAAALLAKQSEEQRAMAIELSNREEAVAFREQRAEALLKLIGKEAPKSLLSRLFGSK